MNSSLGVPLRGSAIGNGWIDARRQYPSYLDYALKHGLVEPGTAVRLQALSESSRAYLLLFQQYERGKQATDDCLAILNDIEGEPINVDFCEAVMQLVVDDPDGAEYVPMFPFASPCQQCLQPEGRPMSQCLRRPSERRHTSMWYELAI